IHATYKRTRTPKPERVWSLMVMRARDQDMSEARQSLAQSRDVWIEEADKIDADDGHTLLVLLEDKRTGHERIMNLGGLAIVTETGQVDRFVAELRRNIVFIEADLKSRSFLGSHACRWSRPTKG